MKRTIIIALSVVALVFGVISYASAIDGVTTVNAKVPGVLRLSVASDLDMGTVSPDADPVTKQLDVTYWSNKPATLSSLAASELNASVASGLGTVDNLRGHGTKQDTIEASVNYDFAPADGVKLGSVEYTLVYMP